MRAPGHGTPGRLLLERESELEAIRSALDQAALRGNGSIVSISGPMGVGKTSLLDAASSLAAADGFRVVSATAAEFERSFPFGIVLALFEPVTAHDADDAAHLFRGRARTAKPLLSSEGLDFGELQTAVDDFALLHGLYWLVVNLSEIQPTLLVIDDVHWADEQSLRFLLYLVQRLQGLPVVVIVSMRPGETSGSDDAAKYLLAAIAPSTSLQVGVLSKPAIATILGQTGVVGVDDEGFVDACWAATSGNPFLLSALVQTMLASDQRWTAGEVAELARFAPDDVRAALHGHVMTLGPDALRVANACAVLAAPATVHTVAAIAEIDVDRASDVASRLRHANVLSDDAALQFAHPMFSSSLIGALPSDEREAMHARAAQVLYSSGAPDEQVAGQLIRTQRFEGGWAVDVLHRAARVAARRGSPSTSVRLLRHAVTLAGDSDRRRPEMLLDLGLAEAATGETAALRHFSEAAEAFGDPLERATALRQLGRALFRYGRADAPAVLKDAADIVERAVADRETVLEYQAAYLHAASHDIGRFAVLDVETERLAGHLRDRQPLTDGERQLLTPVLARDYLTGADADQTALRLRRVALFENSGSPLAADDPTLFSALEGLLYCGRLLEAERELDRVAARAREDGNHLMMAEAALIRSFVMRARGYVDEAANDSQTVIDSIEFGFRNSGAIPFVVLAECALERGDLATSARLLEEAPRGLDDHSRCKPAWPQFVGGRLRLEQGDPETALTCFRNAGAVMAEHGVTNPATLPWAAYAAIAAAQIGDSHEARRLASEHVEGVRAIGATAWIGRGLRAAAYAYPRREAEEMLREAIPLLRESGAELELAKARLALGRLLRMNGELTGAREELRAAMDAAQRLGALATAHRAHDVLLSAGARPRREALTGVNSLTPSERRVAELAAGGRSNRKIAEVLFVSKNTVDWHLRNAYSKLGVRSRDQLRDALASHAAREREAAVRGAEGHAGR